MIFVKKQQGESSDRLIQRFSKRVQLNRLVQTVRNRRYFTRQKNKRKIRQAAIMRQHYRQLREKMQYYS